MRGATLALVVDLALRGAGARFAAAVLRRRRCGGRAIYQQRSAQKEDRAITTSPKGGKFVS